ncbi:MAG: SLBB domain-containing protein [Bacteroidota bacterium]
MNRRSPVIRCLILSASFALLAAGSSAQILERGVSTTQPATATPSYYSLAKPGELTMQVNVWGLITHPGRYEVSITTNLIELISLAGGPAPDADIDEVRITRFLKTESGITRGEYTVNLDDLYRVNESSLVLQPGDTIVIDRSSWVTIRDIIGILTSVAVITATVTTVLDYGRTR